jgi:UDP:flavonoid glycosyltransferase YjiC (YdhE family)
MRVLFTTFPSAAHFFPMVPMAWALRAAGHEVIVAGQPAFLPAIRGAGLTGVAAGSDVDLGAIWTDKSLPSWQGDEKERAARGMRMFAAVGEAMADDVVDFARRWRPDVIVHEPRAYGGLVAAEVLGIPLVRHLWGTDYTCERWEIEAPALAPLLDRHGITDPRHLGAITLDVCPPALQYAFAENRVPMRYVPFNGAGTVPDLPERRPGRPRVCVTWGTTQVQQTGHLEPVDRVVKALAGLDVDIVVAIGSGHRRYLDELPEHAVVLESVPLSLSLPECDAIVHQGGAGTMITAAALGLRQLVVPSAHADQPVNARQLVASGAGRSIPLDDATIDVLRAEIRTLTEDPSYGTAAQAVRDAVTELPSPADLVETVVGLPAMAARA